MKIVVLCGGVSTERDISIVSGSGVCKALRAKGHQAILVDVFFGLEHPDLMNAFPEEYDVDDAVEHIHRCDSLIESALSNPSRAFFGANVTKLCRMADIVFLALHGENGEDGKVQAAFELQKIRYTGAGHLGSAMAMDKDVSKKMLAAMGIPVPKGFQVKKEDYEKEKRDEKPVHVYEDSKLKRRVSDITVNGLELPVVVKVCCGGSSVGVYIARTEEEYREALEAAFSYEDKVIVEEFVEGREFSVGVIDGEALPVIEIAPLEGFYDYHNKYTPGATIETCPADIPPELSRRMREYAVAASEALCLDAYCRMDFIMKKNGEMYCLEANTLPGMTPTSLIPQEAAALGVDYPTLCEKLIEVSLKKYQ